MSLLSLPEEMKLHIAFYLSDSRESDNYQKDLLGFAYSCKALYPSAQELLLSRPTVLIHKLSSIVRLLLANPKLSRRIQSLNFKPRMNPESLPSANLDQSLWQSCESLIDTRVSDRVLKKDWANIIRLGRINYPGALVGVLLLMVPNLRELYLGDGSMLDFPFLLILLQKHTINETVFDTIDAYNHYCVLKTIASQLEVLELPNDWRSHPKGRRDDQTKICMNPGTEDDIEFSNLHTFITPGWMNKRGNLAHGIPFSIETLIFVDSQKNVPTLLNWIFGLRFSAQKRQKYQNLKHIIAHFVEDKDSLEPRYGRDWQFHISRLCGEVGIKYTGLAEEKKSMIQVPDSSTEQDEEASRQIRGPLGFGSEGLRSLMRKCTVLEEIGPSQKLKYWMEALQYIPPSRPG